MNDLKIWADECGRAIGELDAAYQQRFSRGHWAVAYSIEGMPGRASLQKLEGAIGAADNIDTYGTFDTQYNNFPTRRVEELGIVQCSILDSRTCMFWRANQTGQAFMARDYREDHQTVGRFIGFQQPAINAYASVAHACRLATLLGGTSVTIEVTWNGLSQRQLISWPQAGYVGELTVVESAEGRATFPTNTDNRLGIVRSLTANLYDAWGRQYTEDQIKLWLPSEMRDAG